VRAARASALVLAAALTPRPALAHHGAEGGAATDTVTATLLLVGLALLVGIVVLVVVAVLTRRSEPAGETRARDDT
jgi:hypothetical protein